MKLKITPQFDLFPFFKDTSFYKKHKGSFKFEPNKVNVLLGPNGSGKSTLLDILSLLTLAYEFGQSRPGKTYLEDEYWHADNQWAQWEDEAYMAGVQWSEGFCPALSFKPHRIPGNERCITTAMMMGFFDEARSHADLVENKSTGQSVQAQIEQIRQHLRMQGELTVLNTSFFNLHPNQEKDLLEKPYQRSSNASRKMLLGRYVNARTSGHQLVLMDEPEQSLDLRTNLQFWNELSKVELKNTTVIVASHSPFALHDTFNLIEGEKGYAKEIKSLMATR